MKKKKRKYPGFAEKIRIQLTPDNPNKKEVSMYAMAKKMEMSPQGYYNFVSREKRESIAIADLLNLRELLAEESEVANPDTFLLDAISAEYNKNFN